MPSLKLSSPKENLLVGGYGKFFYSLENIFMCWGRLFFPGNFSKGGNNIYVLGKNGGKKKNVSRVGGKFNVNLLRIGGKMNLLGEK
jgi:hypothetical protein